MKFLLWTSLLALGAALYFKGEAVWELAAGFFGPVEVLHQEGFNAEAAETVTARRASAGLSAVQPHEDTQIWLSQRSGAGGLEVSEQMIRELQVREPVFADVVATTLEGKSVAELSGRVGEWCAGQRLGFTHLSTFLYRPEAAPRRIRCLTLLARELPDFEPGLLDQSVAEFCTECRLCGFRQPVATVRGTTGLIMECDKCRRPYGYLQQDLRGRYRYINQFLTGFQPPAHFPEDISPRAEMTAMWKAVLSHCRYAEDAHGVGGPRDQWQLPAETHAYANGDCEDTAILLADWLIARGFDARVALGFMKDDQGNNGGHAWVVCRIDGIDFLLESTEQVQPDAKPQTVASIGRYYSPSVLFDRGTIYFRKNGGWTPDYWSSREWYPVPMPPGGDPSAPPAGGTSADGVLATAAPWTNGR